MVDYLENGWSRRRAQPLELTTAKEDVCAPL
jgi:hypothetical protein